MVASKVALFLCLLISCSCCSEHSTGGIGVSGSAGGEHFEAYSGAFDESSEHEERSLIFIVLSSRSDICKTWEGGTFKGKTRLLFITICKSSDSPVGAFTIIADGIPQLPCNGNETWIEVQDYTDEIMLRRIPATEGIIELHQYEGTVLVAEIDVLFGDGDIISGAFSIEFCDVLTD